MKKIFALVLAVMMLFVGMSVAFADTPSDNSAGGLNTGTTVTPSGTPDYSNPGAPYEGDTGYDTEWRGTADGTLTISGLQKDDTVKLYQILAYDENAGTLVSALTASSDVTKGAQGWKVIAPFATGTNAITGTDLKAILSTGITDTLAGKIAKNAVESTEENGYKAAYTLTASAAGVATAGTTANPVTPGLYVAIVTPAATGLIYNPIFVASDYFKTGNGDNSSSWTVDANLSYSNEAMAKKVPITITKTATENAEADNEKLPADPNATNDAKGVAVGDKIDYTITTVIPEFADNYTDPKYVITDTMVGGLDLVDDSIKVYLDDATDPLAATDHFTLTPASDKHSYTIAFDPAYLLTIDHNTDLKVTYQAIVTTNAVTNVHEEDNTVELEYSHEPSVHHDGTGKKVKDKTHHYTWTIDGSIWGDESWRTIESVKVGLDKDGNEITETTEIQNGYSIGALENAEFALYTNEACTTEYTKGLYGKTTAPKIKSDAKGYLNIVGSTGISGLDAGTYWLKETKAPDGYIKQQEAVKIEIIPTYYGEVSWVDAEGCTITCNDLLKSYIVKINNVQTAEYTINYKEMNQDQTLPLNDETKADDLGNMTTHGEQGTNTIVIGNAGPIKFTDNGQDKVNEEAGKIKNTRGVELPSTGGIGTTIFYIAGSILVLAAVIFLVTKRRMNANND